MILTRRISQCIILTNSSCQMARSLKITRHFSLSSHKKCDKPLVTYDVEPPLENNNNKLVIVDNLWVCYSASIHLLLFLFCVGTILWLTQDDDLLF